MRNAAGNRLRRGRYSEAQRVYVCTAVTADRTPWFADLELGRVVVRSFRNSDELDYTRTIAFVVMPDHFHWLLELGSAIDLSAVVQRAKSFAARNVNRRFGRLGRVWQSGFHDRALRREDDLVAVARYVVFNPVRAGLVQSVREYPLWDAMWL